MSRPLVAWLVAVLLLVCGWFLSAQSERLPPLATLQTKADAIVLLAGSYGERAGTAARLFRAGCASRILLADDGVRRGWSRKHQRNLYAIERAEDALVSYGVPRRAVVRLPFLHSGTVYDALAAKAYVTGHAMHSVVLVTSDYHARRASWTFARVLEGSEVSISVYPATSFAAPITRQLLEGFKSCYYLVRYGLVKAPPLQG